ncbi:hypothetical protein J1TS5_03860 [Paenibacillus macerans]|nr:hypothetical protein J1TS5_03860 [Paenibacillus macerans]
MAGRGSSIATFVNFLSVFAGFVGALGWIEQIMHTRWEKSAKQVSPNLLRQTMLGPGDPRRVHFLWRQWWLLAGVLFQVCRS